LFHDVRNRVVFVPHWLIAVSVGHDCPPVALAIAAFAATAGNPVCSVYQSRSSTSAASNSGAAAISRALAPTSPLPQSRTSARYPGFAPEITYSPCVGDPFVLQYRHGPGVPLKALMPLPPDHQPVSAQCAAERRRSS